MGKKKHEEHFNHEAWIIPYADMVTLLFAFFVVMYAMSLTDEEKMKVVSDSVSQAFVGSQKGGDKTKQIDLLGLDGTPPTSRRFLTKKDITNQEIIDEIQRTLDVEGFEVVYQDEAQPIQLIMDERGVSISISAGYLFAENSTEIPVELYPVIGIVADVIQSNERLILIEGHTDRSPVAGSKFYDNWDLSALRATAMARLLIEQFSIEPKRLSAGGYSHYKPIANNETTVGRAQNRRVDIVMLNASRREELMESEIIPGAE